MIVEVAPKISYDDLVELARESPILMVSAAYEAYLEALKNTSDSIKKDFMCDCASVLNCVLYDLISFAVRFDIKMLDRPKLQESHVLLELIDQVRKSTQLQESGD